MISYLPIPDCGDQDHPDNGRVKYFSTNYKTLASYTCDPGYDLVGNNVRQCEADAFWDSTAPTCEPKGK